jgi:hypothetical protein
VLALIEENIPTTKGLKARQEFLRGVRKTWPRKVSTKVFYPTAEGMQPEDDRKFSAWLGSQLNPTPRPKSPNPDANGRK